MTSKVQSFIIALIGVIVEYIHVYNLDTVVGWLENKEISKTYLS